MLDGDLVLRCTDETLGSEAFEVSLRESEDNVVLVAGNDLFVGGIFRSSRLGVTLLLDRNITDSGTNAATYSGYVITGETTGNTNDGVLFGKTTITGGLIKLELHNASSLSSGSRVASGSVATGAGTTGITLSEVNTSNLNGSVNVNRGTVVAASNLIVNLNVFKIDDKIYITITNDFAGLFSEFFAKVFNFELNTQSSPTISDDMMRFNGLTLYQSVDTTNG